MGKPVRKVVVMDGDERLLRTICAWCENANLA